MADAPEERHVADEVEGARWPVRKRHGYAVLVVAVAGLGAMVAFHGKTTKKQHEQQPPTIASLTPFEGVHQVAARVPLAPEPPVKPPPPMPMAFPPLPPPPPPEDKAMKAAWAASPLLQGGTAYQAPPPAPAAHSATTGSGAAPGGVGKDTDLGAKLHPTLLEGSKATILPHPNLTVTEGTVIPCVLLTALDSSAPGMATCQLQQDVYGTTGNVVLLERGTKIVGEYQSGMHQGQDRLFVLWTRAETPDHVVINLNSPAADALGRSGFSGWIDSHFFQRFGGAIMLSMIDSGFSALSSLSANGGTSLQFGQGQSAASEALQGTINIPPTLKKNEGDVVSVFVARDLDFSGVYGLKMRSGR